MGKSLKARIAHLQGRLDKVAGMYFREDLIGAAALGLDKPMPPEVKSFLKGLEGRLNAMGYYDVEVQFGATIPNLNKMLIQVHCAVTFTDSEGRSEDEVAREIRSLTGLTPAPIRLVQGEGWVLNF